jgi:hypothetical protein
VDELVNNPDLFLCGTLTEFFDLSQVEEIARPCQGWPNVIPLCEVQTRSCAKADNPQGWDKFINIYLEVQKLK